MKLFYALAVFVLVATFFFALRAWWRTPYPIAAIGCWIRGRHAPVRHPLGGFTCGECGHAGAHLGAMGFPDGGYIPSVRRVFERGDAGGLTRTTAWGPGPKGW